MTDLFAAGRGGTGWSVKAHLKAVRALIGSGQSGRQPTVRTRNRKTADGPRARTNISPEGIKSVVVDFSNISMS